MATMTISVTKCREFRWVDNSGSLLGANRDYDFNLDAVCEWKRGADPSEVLFFQVAR
jgi:hypothetical protein